MPDNETNDNNTNKRPKRRAAQRTYVSYENTSVWSEDKDLKKALLASLQDVKRNASKTTAIYGQNPKNKSSIDHNISESDVYSKRNTHNSSQSMVCKESQSLDVDNNCSLLSLAAHRRARVSAQRKFAQSSGFNTNSPVSTPIKTNFIPNSNVVEMFPNQKPKTEDFLTFLCLRRSPILPPNLDFIRLNHSKEIDDKKRDTDCEDISCDELDTNNDKYNSCRLRDSDRRGSASSNISKTTSLSSKASLQISNKKKIEIQRIENKSQNKKSIDSESGLKSVGPDFGQTLKQTHHKKVGLKTNDLKNKRFHKLKQKYKQQRIERKTIIPSNNVKTITRSESQTIKNNTNKNKDFKGIQTRQQLRNHSFNQRGEKTSDLRQKNSNINSSERVLRSHHCSGVCTHSLPKITNNLIRNSRKSIKSLNSSHIGIRPKKRKAKPVVPLIDYYFDSEFESDSSKKNNRINQKKIQSSNESKNLKKLTKDNKSKKIFKSLTVDKEMRTPGRPKGSTKTINKTKTSLSLQPRRLTRSSRPLSPPKDNKDLERERLIKQQIIAIERKHKRLRRFPSDQSLHSSTSTSSSSSSESLPNSSSSSSSINNTRLTRSLEHLKKIRDIAAKLKKQNKKDDKKKNKNVNSFLRNDTKKIKRNENKKALKKKKNEIFIEDSKKTLKRNKRLNALKERTITRRMSESVMTATSDTDCDTEAPECEDVSEMNGTEDSMASIMDEDMERASIVIQDMAEDIITLSEPDLHYGSTEHIQELMTSEFSGAFSEETVTTASAILLPSNCHSNYNYIQQTDDTTQTRLTVDASTNTTEDDIMACLSSDDTQTSINYDFNSKTLSVGTQTTANSCVQTDGLLE